MKKIAFSFLMLIPILWVALSFAPTHEHEQFDRSYYSCSYCCQVVATQNYPNDSGCSKGDVLKRHNWNFIGKAGQDAYGCSYCNTTVYINGYPSTNGTCCAGGDVLKRHNWSKY